MSTDGAPLEPEPGDGVLVAVGAHLLTVLGEPSARASVTFLGASPVDVLRWDDPATGTVRYVTVGMSRAPMVDPAAAVAATHGPRAELVLTLRDRRDSVGRRLAVLAALPVVEGVVVTPGAGLDLGEPLWEGAGFTAVLVGAPGQLVPDLEVPGVPDPVRFLPVLPMTAAEAAWKRVHGATALEQLWLRQGTDLRDPGRAAVRLEQPDGP